jgi:FlaA1/EpsC-like NDP-sugar epimerase
LALRLQKLSPRKLVLLEASESHLHELQAVVGKITSGDIINPILYLGSVTDETLLDEIFVRHRPDYVFHAAAHKHVSLLESQPLAALTNNVLGTQALCVQAKAHGSRVILLSTDKAAAPTSMMGATKRAAELIVLAMGGTAVRLGNVLASHGSVVQTLTRQIAHREPITITDPDAARFWLTVEESTELLISAAAAASERTMEAMLLVPDLERTHLVGELAEFIVKQRSPHRKIPVEVIGLRTGEKKLEVLWAEDEVAAAAGQNGLRRIHTQSVSISQLEFDLQQLRHATGRRDLADALLALHSLVPRYSPSQCVMESVNRSSIQVPA